MHETEDKERDHRHFNEQEDDCTLARSRLTGFARIE